MKTVFKIYYSVKIFVFMCTFVFNVFVWRWEGICGIYTIRILYVLIVCKKKIKKIMKWKRNEEGRRREQGNEIFWYFFCNCLVSLLVVVVIPCLLDICAYMCGLGESRKLYICQQFEISFLLFVCIDDTVSFVNFLGSYWCLKFRLAERRQYLLKIRRGMGSYWSVNLYYDFD